MGQAVYQFSGSAHEFLGSGFSRVLGEEIYSGDVGVRGSARGGDVTLEKGSSLPIPILALRARITTTMRRTHRHVRQDARQFYVVWLIEKGRLSISCSNGVRVLEPHTIMITNANNPFYIEALTGEDGEHRNKLALVPSYLVESNCSSRGQLNAMVFPADTTDGKIVAGLIDLLFHTGEHLEHAEASTMLGLMLRALGRLVVSQTGDSTERRSMHETRLDQIRSYMELHLTDPGLSMSDVARMCGISARYLSQIMRDEGTSFATVLKERRLEEARSWLLAREKADYTIAEIAKMVGFSSGAQLSRSFHAHFHCTPRDFRAQAMIPSAPG